MQWFLSFPPVLKAFIASLLMYFMTALGAACVFLFKKPNGHVLTAMNGFSAGVMISASFFSLLLPAVEGEEPFRVCCGFALGGALLIAGELALSERNSFRLFGDKRNALLFFANTLHNIPEGLSVGIAFAAGGALSLSPLLFALGIAVQNFPEGAGVAFPLRNKGMSKRKSFLFSQGSGLIEIPCCVLGALLGKAMGGFLPLALSLSAGAMILATASELIPECFSGNKIIACAGFLSGFCAMMLLDLAFQ